MGTYATLWRITDADVEELTRHPDRAGTFLFGEPPPEVRETRGLLGFISRFTPITISKPVEWTPDATWGRTRAQGELSLEKAWHGLHFLFTGTSWEGDEPACYLVSGGEDLEIDDGDSPPRLLRAPQVASFASFLAGLSEEELARRYDPRRMMQLEIAPETWDRDEDAEEGETELEHLLGAFRDLRAFVRTAREEGQAIVVHVG
jgi:hypothetical protein